jgi:uncharacterized membrane protein YbhN (UPF0104 family)
MYDRFFVSNMLRGIVGALAHARLPLVVLALALHLTGLAITGERWRVVIAALGSRLRLSRTILINLAGIFVRNATPTTGLGGDASRIALLRAEGVPLPQATAAFAYVRLAEIPALAVVVVLSTTALAAFISRSQRALVAVVLICAATALAGWLFRRRLHADGPGTAEALPYVSGEGVPDGSGKTVPDGYYRYVASLWARTRHLRIDPMSAGLAVFYATLAQVETIVRQIVVAAAFGLPLTLDQSATITAMGIVGGFVPTVGSLGAIDASMVAGLMLFGAGTEMAIAITIAGRAISYGISTALGAIALALVGGRGILRAVNEGKTNTAAAG